MSEEKHIFRFICALLGFASIIIPGPIIPIISLVIVIALFVYKIKRAKESPEGFELLMFDIIIIVIVIVVDIAFFAMRIAINNEYNKYNYSSSSSQENSLQENSLQELAEVAISTYKIGHLSQFTENSNNLNSIKSGFKAFLKEYELTDLTVKGNKIICKIGSDQIIFTITKNDIKYSIK